MPSRKSSAARAPLALAAIVNRPEPEPEPQAAEPQADAPKRAARRRASRAQLAPAAAPMPARQKREASFPHRVTLPLTVDQWAALRQARNEDEIEHSYRVRAAVKLWMEDERLRARINKLAAEDSERDRQARYYR